MKKDVHAKFGNTCLKFWGRYQHYKFLSIINQSHIIHTLQCIFYIVILCIHTSSHLSTVFYTFQLLISCPCLLLS